jgi:uncharacterized circularly permuted ATP-grasp superfamily protein
LTALSGRPYDEAHEADGRPRPHYAELLGALTDPAAAVAELQERLRSRGLVFDPSPTGLYALDPVPRLLTGAEWSLLEGGVAQRLLALEALLGDVYSGDGRVFDAGILEPSDVEGSSHYEPAMRGAAPRRWISFSGLDVVRCPDGRFRVIEDQVRMPSGVAYAVAGREAMRGLLPVEPPQPDTLVSFGELALALQDAAPDGVDEPRVVLLSEGRSAAAWWEHERLARELCAPAVTLGDLEHRDGRLVAWLDGRARAVDVVYLRTDEDRFREPDGSPTAIGEALLEPCAAGRLACVNAPGSGISDDKLIHAHVDEFVSLYLDEEPLLPSIPSRLLDADTPLDDLVVKPRGEMGGEDVVIWRDADAATRERVAARVASEPGDWIGQELVTLSVHPTVCDGRLVPRHVDLRPYAVLSDGGAHLLPAAISRVALEEGSLIVNSGQGGGAKDVWAPV